MKRTIHLSGAILILVISVCLRVRADDLNLLANPDFEGRFEQYGPFRTAFVAEGWTPWWQPQGRAAPAWQNRMPEFKPSAPYLYRAYSGQNAQQLFTAFGTHVGGIYQVVDGVEQGSVVRFTICGHAWAGQGDDPHRSEDGGPMRMAVGIDPTGGTSPFSPRVVWSSELNPLDEWALFEVEATAAGGRVTVFTRSAPLYPTRHNDVYWDNAALIVVGTAPAPTATTRAVSALLTPSPASENNASASPTPTVAAVGGQAAKTAQKQSPAAEQANTKPLPTQTPALTPTPALAVRDAEMVCVSVYEDGNANRERDEGELLVAGAELVLSNEAFASRDLTGTAAPTCFDGLEAMTYYLVVTAPDGYRVLDSRTWRIQLDGQHAHILVGLRKTHTAAWLPEQPQDSAAIKANRSLVHLRWISVVLIACAVIGCAGWWWRKRWFEGG